MEFNEIYGLLEKQVPIKLSKMFCELENMKDNSGIILETDLNVEKIVFSLDLTVEAVNFAVQKGCQLIVTHHPAIYHPIYSISSSSNKALYMCTMNKIGVISMHLNLDIASGGIDYHLAKGLGAESQEILTIVTENQGYGRKFNVDTSKFSELIQRYKQNFNTDKVVAYGDLNSTIKSVASFCGAGIDNDAIEKSLGADLVVSSDIAHHNLIALLEQGFKVLQVTHYSSEAKGHREFSEQAKLILNNKNIYFFEDKRLL